MRKLIAGLALAGLSGCAMMESTIPSPDELGAALSGRFAGRPFDAVLARYGRPDSQFKASSGVQVFEWHTAGTMRFHEPVTTTTTGTIGDRNTYPFAEPIPYSQTTTTRQGYNVHMECTMQVGVRADGTVDGVGFDGKMGACQHFMP